MMRYILISILLMLALNVHAKSKYTVCTIGELKAAEYSQKMWTGPATEIMIVCISDSQYSYYVINKPDVVLFRKLGHKIIFCGTVKEVVISDSLIQKRITLEPDWQVE